MIFLQPYKKYAVFSGRASRKEFWLFTLFMLVAAFVLGFIDGMQGNFYFDGGFGLLSGAFYFASLLPGIAVTIRRLHDTSRSGWWILLSFIPLIGSIWVLVLCCLDSNEGDNDFGASPK